jgi:hypothetical protein
MTGGTISNALAAVLEERFFQLETRGTQSYPDGTSPEFAGVAQLLEEATKHAEHTGSLTWRTILTEYVYAALGQTDPARLRSELVQVAAVVIAWVEDLDRRTAR